MQRTLTSHIINPANDRLTITVIDQPGAGGANHEYSIRGYVLKGQSEPAETVISFQNGPINECGVNGLTHEALLAIVQDRLRSFQAGPFACKENQDALDHVNEALETLKNRTLARMARNVEGTNVA